MSKHTMMKMTAAGPRTVEVDENGGSNMGKELLDDEQKKLVIEAQEEKILETDKEISELEDKKKKCQEIIDKLRQGE